MFDYRGIMRQHSLQFYPHILMMPQELASYMEISMNRAKTLVRCPRFPAKKVNNSNRVKIPLGALNTWLKRFAALSMVSTGDLIYTVECMIDIG